MSLYKELTSENCKDFKNFDYREFACKCGGKYCNGYPVAFSYDLASNLQKVREHFKKALIITSPIRCKQHNKNSGGVSDSKHLKGWACDFYISGVSASELMKYVKTLPYFRYTYKVSGNVIHYDITPPTISEKKGYTGTFPKLPSRGYFYYNPKTPKKIYDKGTQVKNLQKLLNWANGCKLKVDGYYGEDSFEQVEIFQKTYGLKVDKLFGKDCLAKAKTIKK